MLEPRSMSACASLPVRPHTLRRLVLGLVAALALAHPARALTLSLVPDTLAPAQGSPFAVDLVVSGLGNGAAPSLGGFDVTVVFDATQVSFSGASFGAALGSGPAEVVTGVVPGAGQVALSAASLLLPAELDALQPADFVLATLTLTATGAAPSTLAVSSFVLGDGFGLPLGADLGPAVTITPGPGSAVPEPTAFTAYAVGLLVFARTRRRRA